MENKRQIASDFLEMIYRGNIDVSCILFSDEAHLNLDGFVKKQNKNIIWELKTHNFVFHNHSILLKWLYEQLFPLRCNLTLFSLRYSELQTIISNIAWVCGLETALVDSSVTSWFMQDGETPHRTTKRFQLLGAHQIFLRHLNDIAPGYFTNRLTNF